MKLRIITVLAVGLLSVQAMAADQTTTNAASKPAPITMASSATTATQAAPATAATMPSATTPAPTNAAAATTTQPATAMGQPTSAFATQKDKISYSLGANIGTNFKTHNIDIDPTIFARGISDAMAGNHLAMTQQEMTDVLAAFQKQLVAQQQAAMAVASTKNKQASDAFLSANKVKPGVITTSSGLEYKVITKGTGTSPTDKDIVTVDYAGSFPDGKIFDSSYQRGKPVTFPVSEVIPGWTEALKLMQPGSVFEIYIPASLAYGDHGLGNVIGPNQALVFKIHLISVKKTA